MTDCIYCYKSTTDHDSIRHDNNTAEHIVCNKEHACRVAGGLCVWCKKGGLFACNNCDKTGPYLDYPGGSI